MRVTGKHEDFCKTIGMSAAESRCRAFNGAGERLREELLAKKKKRLDLRAAPG